MSLLIENTSFVVTCDPSLGEGPLGLILKGRILFSEGVVKWVGAGLLPEEYGKPSQVIDARGGVVLPGLIDPHTHLVFAGLREEEFSVKCSGAKTYAQIAAEGGGILATMNAVRSASEDELFELGMNRLDIALEQGITTVEIKSGYGLSTKSEIKMLRVIRRLDQEHVVDVIPTFLGAHEVPPEYRGRTEEYVDLVCNEMLPIVAEQNLARFCDVFCEDGVFSVEQSRRILERAAELGLGIKLHADELCRLGGAALAAELSAVSADHLLFSDESDMRAMLDAGVTPVLLPGTSLFLRVGRYADARKMLDMGLPVALATDFNPGSCMTQNLLLMLNLGCTQMRMSAEEAVLGVTVNAAKALALSDRGVLRAGAVADAVVFDLPAGPAYLAYEFGFNRCTRVIKGGEEVLSRKVVSRSNRL